MDVAAAQTQAAPGQDKFRLGAYVRQELKDTVKGYGDAFVGTFSGLKEGYTGLRDAEGLGASIKAGFNSGLKVGSNLGHLAGVPVGVALTVTQGLWAVPIFGLVGGFQLGSKTGEVIGRLATADEPESKKHQMAAVTGSLAGGIGGAVVGFGSPVAAAVGAVAGVSALVSLAGTVGGGAVGAVAGLVTWGAKKALALLKKEPAPPQEPPAQPPAPAPPSDGQQPPAAPAPPADNQPPDENQPPASPPSEAPPREQAA